MPRIARLIVKEEPAVYHVISRTALDSYAMGNVEEEIRQRFALYYGKDDKRELAEARVPELREKWGSLSEFV